jgi:hypothetical protein
VILTAKRHSRTPQASLTIGDHRKRRREAEPAQPWRQAVSALAVYLFQFDATEMFVLSLYREGDNLPAGACQGAWRYKGQLRMTTDSLATLPVDAQAVLSDLQRDGYAIARLPSNLIIFPKASARHLPSGQHTRRN